MDKSEVTISRKGKVFDQPPFTEKETKGKSISGQGAAAVAKIGPSGH
jgi:hypothetical protein